MKTKFILNHIASKTIFCFLVVSLTFANAKSQVTVFSENFDGTVQPYTAACLYTTLTAVTMLLLKIPLPQFVAASSSLIQSLRMHQVAESFFRRTDASGPSYAGSFYKIITLNDTWVAGYTFTISFEVALGDNIAPPVLQPQIMV